MKVIYNNILPIKGYKGINLFGFLFVRKGSLIDKEFELHELIHTLLMQELLYIPFYIIYLIEWFIKLFIYKSSHKAYRNISFEKEAYKHEDTPNYLKTRKHYAQWRTLMNI